MLDKYSDILAPFKAYPKYSDILPSHQAYRK